MKMFTIDEANQLLPVITPKLRAIISLYEFVSQLKEPVRAAASSGRESGGGGIPGGPQYVRSLYDIGKLTTEIAELGVQLKDYSSGLIDFPTMRAGKLVLLCWKLGEAEEIQWWHETGSGFAGRKPL